MTRAHKLTGRNECCGRYGYGGCFKKERISISIVTAGSESAKKKRVSSAYKAWEGGAQNLQKKVQSTGTL
jgi:hypothetical protein